MIKTIPAWSISRLLDFEKCAHRSFLQIIQKSPQPELEDNHPMVRGSRIHKEVEDYISGATDEFPSSGKKCKEILDHCREAFANGRASVEEKWGFDNDWSPVGWFDDAIWLRAATDCTINGEGEAEIFDWKTGKSFGNEVKYMQQMQLYAVGAFMRYPDLEIADVTLGFLDDGKLRTKTFQRDTKLYKLLERFTQRGNAMTNCVDFRPKPSAVNCKWCPFRPTEIGGTGACLHGVVGL
jgi:hypothetical protein